MKSSDEMVNSLLERRKQYIDEQSRKKALRNKHLKFCIMEGWLTVFRADA